MIGPYKIQHATKKTKATKDKESEPLILDLWAAAMIDLVTGRFGIKQVEDKYAHTAAEVVEQTWLCRYPWPSTIILDRGKEFMGDFKRMIKEDYEIKQQPITARNPQANAIIERVHQTICQMLRTHEVQKIENIVDPFRGILSAVCFAV